MRDLPAQQALHLARQSSFSISTTPEVRAGGARCITRAIRLSACSTASSGRARQFPGRLQQAAVSGRSGKMSARSSTRCATIASYTDPEAGFVHVFHWRRRHLVAHRGGEPWKRAASPAHAGDGRGHQMHQNRSAISAADAFPEATGSATDKSRPPRDARILHWRGHVVGEVRRVSAPQFHKGRQTRGVA